MDVCRRNRGRIKAAIPSAGSADGSEPCLLGVRHAGNADGGAGLQLRCAAAYGGVALIAPPCGLCLSVRSFSPASDRQCDIVGPDDGPGRALRAGVTFIALEVSGILGFLQRVRGRVGCIIGSFRCPVGVLLSGTSAARRFGRTPGRFRGTSRRSTLAPGGCGCGTGRGGGAVSGVVLRRGSGLFVRLGAPARTRSALPSGCPSRRPARCRRAPRPAGCQ